MSEEHNPHTSDAGQGHLPTHEEPKVHIVSYSTFVAVWLGLLVLTALTVAVSGIRLHNFSVLTAVLVATVKTLLVLSVFMHLKYEHGVLKVWVFVVVLTLGIFIGLTFVDYPFR